MSSMSTSERVTMMRMRVLSLVPAPCQHITTWLFIDPCRETLFSLPPLHKNIRAAAPELLGTQRLAQGHFKSIAAWKGNLRLRDSLIHFTILLPKYIVWHANNCFMWVYLHGLVEPLCKVGRGVLDAFHWKMEANTDVSGYLLDL